jgi:Domain of unknown function (DUF5063)
MADEMTLSELEVVKSFPRAAEEFCHLIENQSAYTRRQFVDNLLIHLSKLLSLGSQLPDVKPATENVDFSEEEIKCHTEECVKLSNTFRVKFGGLDTYWSVFDPTEQKQSVRSSLSLDLAEIYMDLRDVLKSRTSDNVTCDIYWDWKFDFREHWGRHAVEALKVALFISSMA